MARLLRMPEVAAGSDEAVLAEWPVRDNGRFAADDAIAIVETDKAVVDVPAEAPGVILKTLVAAGSKVAVGAPIAVLGDPGEVVHDLTALLAGLGIGAPVSASTLSPVAPPVPDGTPAAAEQLAPRIFSSPLARRLAKEAGLSLTELAGTGTGPGGRIRRVDVERAAWDGASPNSGTTAPASSPSPVPLSTATAGTPLLPAAPKAAAKADPSAVVRNVPGYQDVPHTRMRLAIAAALVRSTGEAPHFYLRGTAMVDRLVRLRSRLNAAGGTRISINDIVVAAVARTHVLVPEMNVIWLPDAVRRFDAVDVAFAVATDDGLVTPVVRGADRMTVSHLAVVTADLVARARSGRLRQDELEGGAIAVTNLGVFGVQEFAAILNPPQSAILAVGAAAPAPAVRKGKLAVRTQLRVTLSVDHRPIDGAVAARWMSAFVALIEDPVQILR